MYYVLESANLELVTHLINQSDDGFGSSLFKGQLLDEPDNSSRLYVEVESEKVDLPNYFEVDGVPIVDEKFLSVLNVSAVDNYQSFPLDIRFSNGSTQGYYALNVIGLLKCFDSEGDYSKFGPRIMRVFSLKLKESSTYGAYMFRADEYQEIIFISESVKNEIEKNGISGCEIRQADGWNDEHRF